MSSSQAKYMDVSGLEPYPEYKNSGVEWLGSIPKEWDVKRLKYVTSILFSNVDKKSHDNEEEVLSCNYTDVYKNDYIIKDMDFLEVTAKANEISKFLLKKGDVVVTKDSETADDIAIPAYVKDDLGNVLCGYHLAIIRSLDIDDKYLFRIFQSSISNYFTVQANGVTRFGLGLAAFNGAFIAIPPLPEQKTIASFLDREAARIDSLVEKKQQFIERLEEKRLALISHIITKGLYPDVQMKDSENDWIGNVPRHWDVFKLKRILNEKLKYGANESAEFEDENNPRYIRITDFDSHGCLREDTFKSLPLDKARNYLLSDGDILFARSGATVGKTFQFKNYEGTACFAGYLIKASPDSFIICSDYLYLYTKSKSYDNWKNSIFIQATIENIGADKYQYLDVPIPPIPEQQAIVDYLDHETSQIDTLVEKTKQSIKYLKEYRAALITDAVTGKIDVRRDMCVEAI